MKHNSSDSEQWDHPFNEKATLHKLAHFLPAQSPLKDFVHHNTLHAFQDESFHRGISKASALFGYKVYLSVSEYRNLFKAGQINEAVLKRLIAESKGHENIDAWMFKLVSKEYTLNLEARVGQLREVWKTKYNINLDKEVHPLLFRTIGTYLDQGISIWDFPDTSYGFLASLRSLEKNSFWGFLKGKRAKKLLLDTETNISTLLEILVGKKVYYEQYLFDQQFAHPGWAGMVSVIEHHKETLLDKREISLHDFILFELLLEIDALDAKFKGNWAPLAQRIETPIPGLWEPFVQSELHEVFRLWQEAYEWTYFDQVLSGIQVKKEQKQNTVAPPDFQGLFCIDDRECSFRRYIEQLNPAAATYGTPGFFNVEFYFQPEHGKFHTKVCPAPLNPAYLIKEEETRSGFERDGHFTKHTHGFFGAWIISQTFGFWSALKLFTNIFMPSKSPAMVSSASHMDKYGKLSIEYNPDNQCDTSHQIGFKVSEMADRVEGLLKSIGLVNHFSDLIYVVGHGASSINNTHYAGYDCGACSGRPGSVNARVFSYMANHTEVRKILATRGIIIPEHTLFMGALHDTTRDEIDFYPEQVLSPHQQALHHKHKQVFEKALDLNAKERSRRFELVDSAVSAEKVHEKVKLRSVSLFEPRPELNHATNALCIVGRREICSHLFLDRRSFLNSYDYRLDAEGRYLLSILKAAAPVCGGINLEYYFSRVDNHKLGAGTKLPHNVVGLIGVANGMDGDLRPGLPSQMIEVHDPLRLMIIVEQFPDRVLDVIQRHEPTYEWFRNEWVYLSAVHPETKEISVFKNETFVPYHCLQETVPVIEDLNRLIESTTVNFPVYQFK